ncbi:MAG: hypothetical protein MI974_05035 [Chitinophagales bacterium]|nr:hypothetical protein [Chitinophagales bacterium]
MSYFNQIIQRSEGAQMMSTLSPVVPAHSRPGMEEGLHDPFMDPIASLEPNTQSVYPSTIAVPTAPTEQTDEVWNIPEVKPGVNQQPEDVFLPRIISKTTILEEKTTEQLTIAEQTEKSNAASDKNISSFEERRTEPPKAKETEKAINEKLILRKPFQEIPPIEAADFKAINPEKEEQPVAKEKKKATQVEREPLKKQQPPSIPQKRDTDKALKTLMQPRKRENSTEIPRKKPEKKLSIGKITVEMGPRNTPTPTPTRTVYRTRNSGGTSSGTSPHSLRYSLRFGLGQL